MNQNHQALIRRVSKQVAFRTNPRYGYEICTPEDISQGVWIHLIKDGVDLDLMDSPEAYVRKAATFEAFNIVNQTIRRPDQGDSGLVFAMDFHQIGIWEDYGGEVERVLHAPTGDGPEEQLLYNETVETLSAVVAAIVAKVADLDQREAVEGFYLRGEEQPKSSAVVKRRYRGQQDLTPEELASLQVWRAWLYPELGKQRSSGKVPATPLIEALS